MGTHASPTLRDVFDVLDRWRHLPSYRLEPQVAPFIALYLRHVLERRLNVDLHPVVIPEFPLRLGTLLRHGGLKSEDRSKEASDNQSVKVDYVAFSRDRTRAYLVELKTDDASMESGQEKYLCAASRTDFHHLVAGIVCMCKASKKKQKYVHLLHRLSQIGFLDVGDELYEKSFRKFGNGQARVVPGWTKALQPTRDSVDGRGVMIEVVYIKPTNDEKKQGDFHYIDFDEVAGFISENGELGRLLACFLRRWTVKAGSLDPRSEIAAV